jgi:hypothetical protein
MTIIEKTLAYRQSSSLNQSKLNWIRTGFKKVNVNDGMTYGNILEVKMCYPELFDELFIIGSVPGGRGAEIIRKLVEDNVDLDNMTDKQIKFYCTEFYEKSSIDSRHNSLLKLHQYYDDLRGTSGKTLVEKKFVDIIDRKLEQIDHRFITEGAVFQEWVEFEFMGEVCKALLDVVNYQWFDIKSTTKSLMDWPRSIEEYGYDVQAYWYDMAIKTVYPNIEFGGYYVVPVMTNEPARVFKWDIYEAESKVIDLVNAYKWHKEHNVWYSRELWGNTVIDLTKTNWGWKI